MLKKLFQHSAIYGLAPQLPKIASLFVLPIITQDLTKLDYGIAGVIQAYTSAFSVLQSLGIAVVLANSFHKYPSQYKWLWRQLHGFISVWSLVYGFLLATFLYFVIPKEAENYKWLIIALNTLPPTFFATTETFVTRYYQLSLKPFPIAIRSILLGAITVLLNLFTISYLKLGFLGWFISSFTSSLLSFAAFIYPIYIKAGLSPIFNFKYTTIKKSLSISLPTVPHYYSNYLLNTSDRLVLDIVNIDIKKIGFYNFASNFGSYFSAVVNGIGMAAGPIFLKLYKDADNRNSPAYDARKLTFLLQTAFLVVTFVICLWLKEFFQIIVKNEELQLTYPLAIIIIMGYNYRPMYIGSSTRIFYSEKTKSLWKISFLAGVSNVILNIITIPFFGLIAAAINTFISLMYMGYSGFFIKEFKNSEKLNYYPLIWLLATVGITLTVYLFKDFPIYLKVSISVGLALLLAFLSIKNKHLLKK